MFLPFLRIHVLAIQGILKGNFKDVLFSPKNTVPLYAVLTRMHTVGFLSIKFVDMSPVPKSVPDTLKALITYF